MGVVVVFARYLYATTVLWSVCDWAKSREGGGGTSTIYWWGSPGAVKTYPNSADKPP